jgi:hypothetical protein
MARSSADSPLVPSELVFAKAGESRMGAGAAVTEVRLPEVAVVLGAPAVGEAVVELLTVVVVVGSSPALFPVAANEMEPMANVSVSAATGTTHLLPQKLCKNRRFIASSSYL